MAKDSKIEWTDHTFNPWEGCMKVSPACDNCYAETRNARFGGGTAPNWGVNAPRRRTSAANWKQPLKWNAEAELTGTRPRVFCASLADVFDNQVPSKWRTDLFQLIDATPHLDWLLLTKRIGNVLPMMAEALSYEDDDTPVVFKNVWLGATICNQDEADRDIPKLLNTPAAKRFLSIEPMLGEIDLVQAGAVWYEVGNADNLGRIINQKDTAPAYPDDPQIDWIICGGESGAHARPMQPDWARSLRDQCERGGIPFFFKQWGEFGLNWLNDDDGNKIAGSEWVERLGKKIAGRMLDGREWNEVPDGV